MKKPFLFGLNQSPVCWLLAAGALLVIPAPGSARAAEEERQVVVTATANAEDDDAAPGKAGTHQKKIIIQSIDPDGGKTGDKEVTWLGVSAEETSEALASQLGLQSGEGLLVTYVAPDGPASKAGLKKNDVLAELGDQLLVHPAQLRKLVQMRKEGDSVKLTYYRGGKKQTATATLGKTKANGGYLFEEHSLNGDLGVLHQKLRELNIESSVRDQLKAAQDAFRHSDITKEKIRIEVQHSLEEARKALRDALRSTTNTARWAMGAAGKELDALTQSGVDVEKDATVIVKDDRKSVKTIVKTDDTGTYVLVANPQKRLTARDKDGKLLFDGSIDTPEQQSKVPQEVWERVKPMVDQLGGGKTEDPSPEDEADKKPNS